MPVAETLLISPQRWAETLAQVAAACASIKGVSIAETLKSVKPSDQAARIAQNLCEAADPHRALILLGNSVLAHPQASHLWANAQLIAQILGCRIGFTVQGANGVGGYLAKATPQADGVNAATMFADSAESYVLVNVEPAMDCANPHQAKTALKQSKGVIALSSFKDSNLEFAQVALPITPFTETSATYVNCEGRMQTALAANAPRGQARPGWKVLRVLGNLVSAEGFDFESSEEVRQSLVGSALSGEVLSDLSFACEASPSADPLTSAKGFELTRLGDVPIYRSDSLVRHAPSLQEMPCSSVPKARMNPVDISQLGLAQGSKVRVSQEGKAGGLFDLVADAGVARGVLRLSTGFGLTSDLGGLIACAQVEAA